MDTMETIAAVVVFAVDDHKDGNGHPLMACPSSIEDAFSWVFV